MTSSKQNDATCRILTLDGGGAKGFYTLGVLRELEALLGRPICESFELIFGTSTGAIIAALLALGHSVDEVHALYSAHVPTIMGKWTRRTRSDALDRLTEEVFKKKKFDAFKTGVGIVATRWDFERPMIFKGSISQAHGLQSTFEPGFGCTIADAVRASCSAYPFFRRPLLKLGSGDEVEVLDGGYCANNPTLYAIADAVKALNYPASALRVVSIGVGHYPDPGRWKTRALKRIPLVRLLSILLQKTLDINTTSMEQLRSILFRDISAVRINDRFDRPELATDLMENDLKKLNQLHKQGRESFAKHEKELKKLLTVADRETGSAK
jgi:uncharacterized protein